ncbi:MAG: hypothetical protein ACRD08_23980, partial [Acidimicrobiales bacterium]
DRLFDAQWRNTDSVDEALAKAVLDGRHAWFEADVLDPSEGTGPWIAEPGATSGSPDVHRFVH